MGLLEKITDTIGFERKICPVCGEKMALIGNFKTADGIKVCKNCRHKMSYYIASPSKMSLEEVSSHLKDREQNKEALKKFTATHVVNGEAVNLYIDFDTRRFILTTSSNYMATNEDIFSFDEIELPEIEIREDRTEETYKDAEGKNVRYNPPRYKYSYDFYLYLRIRRDFYGEMALKLNSFSVNDYHTSRYDRLYIQLEELCEILCMLRDCTVEELEEAIEYYREWMNHPTRFNGAYYFEDRKYRRNGDYYSHRDPRTRHTDYRYNYR